MNKPGVQPYSPFLPHPAVFEKSIEFREFLLTKCIFILSRTKATVCIANVVGVDNVNLFFARGVVHLLPRPLPPAFSLSLSLSLALHSPQ